MSPERNFAITCSFRPTLRLMCQCMFSTQWATSSAKRLPQSTSKPFTPTNCPNLFFRSRESTSCCRRLRCGRAFYPPPLIGSTHFHFAYENRVKCCSFVSSLEFIAQLALLSTTLCNAQEGRLLPNDPVAARKRDSRAVNHLAHHQKGTPESMRS